MPCHEVLVKRQGEGGDRALPVGSTHMGHEAGCTHLGVCAAVLVQSEMWEEFLGKETQAEPLGIRRSLRRAKEQEGTEP